MKALYSSMESQPVEKDLVINDKYFHNSPKNKAKQKDAIRVGHALPSQPVQVNLFKDCRYNG
jgi:hypothetical protein